VLGTRTGFMGGNTPHPTYREVCEKTTGHAETVEVVYDVRQLTTRRLLGEFFMLHDFTQDRRSRGGQYRSAIFFDPSQGRLEEQLTVAKNVISLLSQNGFTPLTELNQEGVFYPADSRHQQFCAARGMQPKRRLSARIKEILTF